jgi:hypothetical protein
MADIGIIGSGIAGLQLGLGLQRRGIDLTIYSEWTPEQQLTRQLSNMVARNGCTREREGQLGVNHWDSPLHDMPRLAVSIRGTPIAFSGLMGPPAQAVDMRMYCARLLEDFSSRGGRVVIRTFQADEIEGVAARHDLLVVASGRASLTTIFPRVPEDSPYTSPQRLCVCGFFRGVAYSEPRALEVIVTPGSGEILVVPVQSHELDLTGIGILITAGGLFEPLRHLRYKDDPRAFIATVLTLLREHAPTVYERIDTARFELPAPLDLAHAAITPTVRRGFAELSNGRTIMALGDAHVVIDPITGQGANSASHAAKVLCEAIARAETIDRAFCQRVEQEVCSYAVPVSDAANARLQPPTPHVRQILGAATRDQAIANAYADGYNHPDRFWAIASSPERTAAFLEQFERQRSSATVAS